MEEKWADRRAICMRLAAQNGIPLTEDRIICEQESGATIDDRALFVGILDRIRAGKTRVLVSPYQDRLGRPDLGDLDRIEKAFLRHASTLVCSEWPTGLTFDRNYQAHSGALFGMQAVMSRARLGTDSIKRTQTNISKVKRNHRHSGPAPYGYRTLYPPVGIDGRRVDPTGADIEAGTAYRDTSGAILWHRYRTDPDQYPILEEMCRRMLLGESGHAIAMDFNARRIKPPRGQFWQPMTARRIVVNPFNAGRLAIRARMTGDGRVEQLAPSDYIMADTDGDWPHPLTMVEYHEIVNRMERRGKIAEPRTGLLSGLIRCSQGHSMLKSSDRAYGCRCKVYSTPHRGTYIGAVRVETWIAEVIAAVIEALPEEGIEPKGAKRRDRSVLYAELSAARSAEEKAARAVDNLLAHPDAFMSVLAEKGYDEALGRAEHQRREAITRREEIEREISLPDAPRAFSYLTRLKQAGFLKVWHHPEMTPASRREIVEQIIERVTVEEPVGRFITTVTVKFHDWLKNYPSPKIPRFPKSRSGLYQRPPAAH